MDGISGKIIEKRCRRKRLGSMPQQSTMELLTGARQSRQYRDLKKLKIWLKKPILRPPKFTFLEVLTPKCYFSLL